MNKILAVHNFKSAKNPRFTETKLIVPVKEFMRPINDNYQNAVRIG